MLRTLRPWNVYKGKENINSLIFNVFLAYYICCIITGIFWHSFQLLSCGYISTEIETNLEIWFCTNGRFGIISSNRKLYIYFIVDMKIKLVGWFIEIVELKKYGVILGAVLSNLRLMKQEFNFWIISICVLQRKKWGLFSGCSLQELHSRPESENLEVTFWSISCF